MIWVVGRELGTACSIFNLAAAEMPAASPRSSVCSADSIISATPHSFLNCLMPFFEAGERIDRLDVSPLARSSSSNSSSRTRYFR